MVATKILNGIEVDGSVTADEFVGPLKGNATSATTAATASKLSSNAGSATKPIYFENGVPKVTTYELNKTVPADAKFTDTTYSAKSGGGLELDGTEFSVKTGFTESGRNYAVVKDAAGDLYVSVPWTDTTDYTKLSNRPTIPSKTSDLTNDSGFITKAISDLTNYYTKTETYTKTEVNNLISAKLVFSVVSSLPASGDANTIYLVPAASSETDNEKDEYIWVNSKWELIGSTNFQLTITQNASGISINNTALQTSSATQAGLMTSAQVTALDTAVQSAGTKMSKSGTTLNHASTTRADTTSTASPAHSGTFTAVDSVTTDATGHVTAINVKTVTLPSDSNTDTQVTQTATTSSNDYPILVKNTTGTSGTTAQVRFSSNSTYYPTMNPSTGVIKETHDYSIGNASYPLLMSSTSGVSSTADRGRAWPIVNNQIYANPSTGNLVAKTFNGYTLADACEKAVGSVASGNTGLVTGGDVYTAIQGITDSDTKNTAGSTNTSSKIYLIGATSQAANPQTYSHDTAYVGTDGCLYSGGTKVLTAHQSLTDYVTKTGSEALTNKTYNGYTLGAACAKGVATSAASGGTDLITSGGAYSASHLNTATVTVPAAVGTSTVTVSGMTSTAVVWVSPAPASFSVYAAAGVYCSAQSSGSLTFTKTKAASESMTVNIVWKEP